MEEELELELEEEEEELEEAAVGDVAVDGAAEADVCPLDTRVRIEFMDFSA